MRLHQPTVQELQNALASAKTCVSKIEEALGTAGKPGSGPEFPPEGYRLSSALSVRPHETLLWMEGETRWKNPGTILRDWQISGDAAILAMAVPIVPKPEPVKLSDQEKIAGWRGPTGFRLQTFSNRTVECVICKQTIRAGERLARWRSKFPKSECRDHVVGHPASEENHAHAHVGCLYMASRNGYPGNYPQAPRGLAYYVTDIPPWLCAKRNKFDKQN